MDTVAYESVIGVSYGLLIAVVTASLVAAVAIGLGYVQRRRLPRAASGVIAITLTVGIGYAIGVFAVDPLSAQAVRIATALFVTGVIAAYAGSLGWRLATELPRKTSLPVERGRTLSGDAIDAVDVMGQVTIRASGEVRAFEGYPPLDPDLRAALEDGAWRLPADLPLAELETRLEDRLQTTYDLEAASVAVDGRGWATITAAPPSNGIARQVPKGWRAVSVPALLPTGLAPGDDVLAMTDLTTVAGTVLSTTVRGGKGLRADGGHTRGTPAADSSTAIDDRPTGTETGEAARPSATAVRGGEGQVTVAVPTTDAETLLEADRARIVVEPGETTHEFDAVSLLERDGTAIRKVTLTEPILEALDNDALGLEVFAVRRDDIGETCDAGETDRTDDETGHADATAGEWQFDPDPSAIAVGVEAFLLGTDGSAVDADPDPDAAPRDGDRRSIEVAY
ncbi:hypothetical protein Htur_0341 [Haloterrigena turkmenica DSM 5511]|uniref:RCK C-terminal domain-containing protein n=1 Tax=Haloterrigena turkmenica (strain ATCC 51198 / DSM 5511 / JCM 9101 / NCIMB 13204 / VKM B-1734 / 4k) TaxID=543526 RepID=D2RUU9_HALTV|nr:hypothetical protein [Haloterrigena turkmenica]ADB59242.1 hypothetical protein Htur_0341 [Haloterrigena turkmenica DSM 5511]